MCWGRCLIFGTWFLVLAQPDDLGQVISFLLPPMKWGISQGCCETQVESA